MRVEEQWSQPLPAWTEAVRAEIEGKIQGARFVKECQAANLTVVKNIVILLWPFVQKYPALIESGVKKAKQHLFRRFKICPWWNFRTTGATMVGIMQREEEEHGELWLTMGSALSINLKDVFYRDPRREIEPLIDAFIKAPDPATFFFRAAAVEILAELMSVQVLKSDRLKKALGSEGCKWFLAHAHHPHEGITHEVLMYHLGFWFFAKEPGEYYVNTIVQHTVNPFVKAAEGTVR